MLSAENFTESDYTPYCPQIKATASLILTFSADFEGLALPLYEGCFELVPKAIICLICEVFTERRSRWRRPHSWASGTRTGMYIRQGHD